MIRPYSLTLSRKWSVTFQASAEQVEAMRRDGYVIDELLNRVPDRLPACLVRPLCRLQDAWQWLRVI